MATERLPGVGPPAARLASAQSIVQPRSATCGRACRTEPCTLRQIRQSERGLVAESWLVIWAELSVLAHLVGEAMPVVRADLLDGVAAWDPRHRECAVAHAVDGAVASRTPAFATLLSPGELAAHVAEAINAWVERDESGCDDEGCRRWAALRSTDRSTRMIGHGADEPSRLESAVGGRVDDAGWLGRLGHLLEDFVGCDWPRRHLIPGTPGGDRP